MYLRKKSLSVIAWIALFAIVMAALAPTVSRAIAAHGRAGQPPCHLSLQSPASSRSGAAVHAEALVPDDCGYCSLQGQLPALPSLKFADLALLVIVRIAPPLFYVAPQPLFAWLGAQSRAPPAAS